ncbi:hypothetical protein [Celeribacter ethanolicus]|uniref:hypothetical protein n=1 Tax=Celeribacter ethanolicus TaxID=1758178 RepID=UPI0012FE2423|nr:hypothetical protein [Celeribacter ethanolicus]
MSSIKCYGVHYELEMVEKNNFNIFGWEPTYEDWRSEPRDPEFVLNDQRGVYILQDVNRTPLYVGRVGTGKKRLGNRLWDHTRNDNRKRWTHFSWFGLNEPSPYQPAENASITTSDLGVVSLENKDETSLEELEAFLISAIDPPLNKKGGDWGSARKILQWSPWEKVSLSELSEELHKLRRELKKISQ